MDATNVGLTALITSGERTEASAERLIDCPATEEKHMIGRTELTGTYER